MITKKATIPVTLELGSVQFSEGMTLTCCAGPSFSPFLSMLTSNLDNSIEKQLENNTGREKDRTV